MLTWGGGETVIRRQKDAGQILHGLTCVQNLKSFFHCTEGAENVEGLRRRAGDAQESASSRRHQLHDRSWCRC